MEFMLLVFVVYGGHLGYLCLGVKKIKKREEKSFE